MKKIVLPHTACSLVIGLALCSADAADVPASPAASAAPSTQPATDVPSLIHELSDDSFLIRLDAADKLRQIGKPALPALTEATQSPSLEVRIRAGDLIYDIQHPALPPERVPLGSGTNGNHSVAITRNNRMMVVIAKDPGRTTRIEEGDAGIHMTVTGQLDGQECIREFNAETPAALKKANPEAYALYEESTGLLHGMPGRLGGNMILNQVQIPGGPNIIRQHIDIRGGAVRVVPIPDAPQPPATQPSR